MFGGGFRTFVLVSFSCYMKGNKKGRDQDCFSFFQLLLRTLRVWATIFCFSFFQLLQKMTMQKGYARIVLVSFSCYNSSKRLCIYNDKVLVSFSCYLAW